MSGRIRCSDGIIDYAGDMDHSTYSWKSYEEWMGERKRWKVTLVMRWNSVTRNKAMLKSKYGIITPKEMRRCPPYEDYQRALDQYVDWRDQRMHWAGTRYTTIDFLKHMGWLYET